MTYRGGGTGSQGEDKDGEFFIGESGVSLADAIAAAVDHARKPHGTWFKVEVFVESVDDPNVGTYGAKVRESQRPGS